MDLIDERIIKISRRSMAFMTILGLTFMAVGYWQYQMNAFQLSQTRHHNSLSTTHAMGILSIVAGIFIVVFMIKTIFDNKPGLILNSKGILKYPNAPTALLIPWSDINNFEVVKYRSDERLVVKVKDPEKYRGTSGRFSQNILDAEALRFGSPVTISTTILDIDVEDLQNLCNSYLAKYLESWSQFG